jgi:hypothetical protein
MTLEVSRAEPRAGSTAPVRGRPLNLSLIALFIVGAAMLAWTGILHLYLWGSEARGYREVPTIGPLFLVQGIVGCVLAVVAVVCRRLTVALVGALYMAVSIGGLWTSIHRGMFGFQETSDAPYVQMTFIVEVVGLIAFVAAMILLFTATRGRAND